MQENIYFETIKCEDFEIFNLDFHNKRVANTIGLNINLQEYIYPLSEELLRCKVTYNDSEVLNVEYFPYKKREINSFKLLFDDEINYSKKYLNREKLNNLFLQKEEQNIVCFPCKTFQQDMQLDDLFITAYYARYDFCQD